MKLERLPGHDKINSRLLARIYTAGPEEDTSERRLRVTIRVKPGVRARDLLVPHADHISTRVGGRIVTATVSLDDIKAIAALDDVVSIDGGDRLYPAD